MSKRRAAHCPACRAGQPCPCPTPCPEIGEWIWSEAREPHRLVVHTARVGTEDPDRLDVTRKSADAIGVVFAPSWKILKPALEARTEAVCFERDCQSFEAKQIMARAWELYVPLYKEEMRHSYRRNRAQWNALLARERVVLLCYCVDAKECHRTLLAEILSKLGADVRGELESPQKAIEFYV